MTALRVVTAGPGSTVQDAGRIGHQRFGVSVAGAADPLLHAVANALVGNPLNEGAIEFTLTGDRLMVEGGSCRIAVAAEVAVFIDDAPVPAWTSHRLADGQSLRIGALRRGARGYLAVAGGFAVAPVLGSVSVHARSGVGGWRLAAGDRLPLRAADAPDGPDRTLDPERLPRRGATVRVVLGPQHDHFTAAGIATFLGATYTVTREADRMGCRLSGPAIEHADGFNITSDGIPLGAIQVPGTGQPIVMLADRQTTGGYPKIACAITPDVAALAQMRPGDHVRFRAVSASEARTAYRAFRALVAGVPDLIGSAAGRNLYDSERLLSLTLLQAVDGLNPDSSPM